MGARSWVLIGAVCLGTVAGAWAQTGSGRQVRSVDLAVGYTAIDASAYADSCGCFWLQGVSAQAAVSDPLGFGMVFDFGRVTGSQPDSLGRQDLTLATYLAGPRYTVWNRSRFTPYVQVLFGAAQEEFHTILENTAPATPSSGTAVDFASSNTSAALAAGTGVDVKVSRYLSWRIVQAEYLLTEGSNAANGSNGRENQLRLTSGLVARFP